MSETAAPLLLLHAATRDRHDFEALLPLLPVDPPLAPRAVDLPGHGEAPRAPRYRITDLADATQENLGPEPAVLYGHSLGGLVAVALAARHPERVRGLVLEDPPLFESRMPRLADTPFFRGFRALKALMEGPAAGYTLADWEREVASWRSGHGRTSVAEALGPDGVRRRARQIAAFDPAVLDTLMGGELHAGFDMEAALRSVRCPAVLLAGERQLGSALSAEDLRHLALATTIRVDPVAGEGHFIHEVLPRPCAAAVTDVLSV
jgi:pimeloyl-ACP methyl ester carboxylesterase